MEFFINNLKPKKMKRVTDEIRSRISIPPICFYKHANGGRGIYYIDGHVHYIHIDTPIEQAEALKLTNHIHSYEVSKNEVKMYTMHFQDGRFIERECSWGEFTLKADDILELAAHQEFEKACRSIGIPHKVINLYNKIKNRTAA